MFKYEKQSDDFYKENPDFYLEGYVDYNAYGILINNSNYYLNSVKDVSVDITIILTIVTSLGVILFAFYTIKKYSYKIGILKALVTRNKEILAIFGLQIIIMGLISFLFAVPSSIMVMNRVNFNFVKDINPNLVFFSINGLTTLFVFLSLIGLLTVFSLMPMIKLFMSSPAQVIKRNIGK